jgi:ABC-2 type transport system ATP-binding protein
MTTTAAVRVRRTGGSSSPSRAWDVLIDGSVVGTLPDREPVEFAVEPGPHTVRIVSMRFLGSPEQHLDVEAGQVLGFSCRARPRHPLFVQRSIIFLVASLFSHRLWITITADDSDGAGTEGALARVPVPEVAPATPRPPPTGEPVLIVDHLTKRFGHRTAFSDVSFEVAPGEVFGFLGPNGAGKTTTVRTLGTLIAPTSGSATIAGVKLSPENGVEIRQRIAIMPEAPGLYLRLTVSENLEYFAGLYGLDQSGTRIRDALAAVNLGDRAGDMCSGLSKGLRQRVGLARTLLSDPKIMFLDEPTSGLDPLAAVDVHNLIIGLRERGVTIFLTTHRLDEAEKLCDRVAILNTTLRTIGRPEDLREQLFKKTLLVKTLGPLINPAAVFGGVSGIEEWHSESPGSYELSVADIARVAPEVTRTLVGAGADVLCIGEVQHSLEDVYLELIHEDVEARAS